MKLQSINPHDQSVVGELPISSKQEVDEAVAQARKAFERWRFTPIQERIAFIQKYRASIGEHAEELAQLITKEMGKPIKQAREDITWELDFVDYYIQKGAENLADETVWKSGSEHFRITFEPFGVVACIAPWNFPLGMFNSGVLPALIAGNTVVFKPSEYTSLSQKFAFDLLQKTGLPEGVLNIVIGASEVGRHLIDAEVDLVWFTGSSAVGQEIYKRCGEKFIKAICELGGSSAGIIFADADLDNAFDNLFWARFLNCGQVCSAVNRLFVEKPLYEKVVKHFVKRLKSVSIGNPMDEVEVGPLVSKKQLATLIGQVKDAVAKGAQVESGGKQPTGTQYAKGNYFEPTILTNIIPDMKVFTEETFGPVLPIIPFENEEQVIRMANHTHYGLSAEVYTSDIQKAERVAKRLQSGTVAINTDSYYKPSCPIGGYKKSGIGREYGKLGMQEFTQIKLIALKSS